MKTGSLRGGKGGSSFYMAGNGFLVIFFERGVPRGNTRLSDHVAFGLVYPLPSIIPP